MNRMFLATFMVAFVVGLVVGLLHAPLLAKAKAQDIESPISSPEPTRTYIVTIGGVERHLSGKQCSQLAEAFANITYSYYQFKDYESFDLQTFEKIRPYTFWDDCISEGSDYEVIDSLLHHNWGDFFNPIDE